MDLVSEHRSHIIVKCPRRSWLAFESVILIITISCWLLFQIRSRRIPSSILYWSRSANIIQTKKSPQIVRPRPPMCWQNIFSRQTLLRIHWIFWCIYNYYDFKRPINTKCSAAVWPQLQCRIITLQFDPAHLGINRGPVEAENGINRNEVPIFRRLEVDNDVISGVAVDNVGMGIRIKFGAFRSNGFRDIRGADFVSNDRTNIAKGYSNSAKRDGVSPKNTEFPFSDSPPPSQP